jgi:putative CocE/NonD family hydrolase
VTARFQPYYLQSSSNASDVFSGGQLSATDSPARGQPDSYRFDPTDTSGPEIEAEAHTSGGSLTDQTVLFALRGKELVYHTAPFQQDTEVSGFFRLAVWISIDCPDTDLYASVYEIAQDGRSIRLSTDAIRARYREGLRTPTLIREYIPLRYEFDHFTFISREVKRGARLRLVIAPMGRIIETTFAEKNYNSGAVVANETQNNGKTVTVRLVHERAHPSALYVPLGQPSSAVP